jgi:methylenetetrahydrofolate--tRNA-(uracil-5-)-methyltransferase
MAEITIIGGGLAGCEAAWQAARRGVPVRLVEMRPDRPTEAHKTGNLAELVCSNSLRSDDPDSAVGALKAELRLGDSLILAAADACRVPAGQALAVDRVAFSRYIAERLAAEPRIAIERGEATALPAAGVCVVATGPLTSPALAAAIQGITGDDGLYFYDAISPIVEADSIDRAICFAADRYGKGDGDGDYLNCPLDEGEYAAFYAALRGADTVPLAPFEEAHYFEGCLPIEVLAGRGPDTLRFGPMKPVGLVDPRSGVQPYAVVQLRPENRDRTAYNLVGFQTKLTYPAQEQVLRLIPGLGEAAFLRHGSIHRNTFLDAPRHLTPHQEMRRRPGLFFAGQITGVEGYVESTASGWLAGICAARRCLGLGPVMPPPESALGALIGHVTTARAGGYQPTNVNLALYPPLADPPRNRQRRRAAIARRGIEAFRRWHEATCATEDRRSRSATCGLMAGEEPAIHGG